MRPDQKNINALLDHIKSLKFGETTVKIKAHDGWMISFEEIESKRGTKFPLEKRRTEGD